MEFSTPAHSLLMKTEAIQTEHQENKNRSASFQASPQATRKKRYTKLNFATLASSGVNEEPSPSREEKEDNSQGSPKIDKGREMGSFDSKAARNRLSYA